MAPARRQTERPSRRQAEVKGRHRGSRPRNAAHKGESLGLSLFFSFGAENGTRTRAARERFRELLQTPPAPGRGALRSQVPSPSCVGIRKEGRTFRLLPSSGAENGTRTRAARERFRELLQTPPAPGRGALRSQVPSPSCVGIRKEGRTFRLLPSSGAENGTRTRDLNLGKVALYQLSYFRMLPAAGRLPRGLLPVFWDCKYKRFFRFRKIFPQKSTFFSSRQPYLPIKKGPEPNRSGPLRG